MVTMDNIVGSITFFIVQSDKLKLNGPFNKLKRVDTFFHTLTDLLLSDKRFQFRVKRVLEWIVFCVFPFWR